MIDAEIQEEICSILEHASTKTGGVRVQLAGLTMYAWPVPILRPTKLMIDIVAVDDIRLKIPQTYMFDLSCAMQRKLAITALVRPVGTGQILQTGDQTWEKLGTGTPYMEWSSRIAVVRNKASRRSYMSHCFECGHLLVIRETPREVKKCRPCRRFHHWRDARLQTFLQGTNAPRPISTHRPARIRELAATRKYSNVEIAALVGVTPQYVSKVLRGGTSSSSIRATLRALKLKPQDFQAWPAELSTDVDPT